MKNENLIITGFIGFTTGVCLMMLVNTDTQVGCYEIIEDIGFQVCEKCWYNVFECGEKYEEVKDYVDWE